MSQFIKEFVFVGRWICRLLLAAIIHCWYNQLWGVPEYPHRYQKLVNWRRATAFAFLLQCLGVGESLASDPFQLWNLWVLLRVEKYFAIWAILSLREVSMLGNESSTCLGCLTSSSFRISSSSSWVRIWVSPGRREGSWLFIFYAKKRRASSKCVYSMKARTQVNAQASRAYLSRNSLAT